MMDFVLSYRLFVTAGAGVFLSEMVDLTLFCRLFGKEWVGMFLSEVDFILSSRVFVTEWTGMFLSEVMDFALSYDVGKNFVFNKAKSQVMKMTSGLYPAPLKILEVGTVKYPLILSVLCCNVLLYCFLVPPIHLCVAFCFFSSSSCPMFY